MSRCNVAHTRFHPMVLRHALIAGILCVLIDLDHVPYFMELYPEGRPLHLFGLALTLLGTLYFSGILRWLRDDRWI